MEFDIELAGGTLPEISTRATLLELADSYPLDRYVVTHRIRVEADAHPHSHPVLTLNAAHQREPLPLLAQLIHEEMHWALMTQGGGVAARRALLETLQIRFPGMPVARPDGSGDITSTYFHIAVCAMEFDVLTRLVGAGDAEKLVRERAMRFYRAVYDLVLCRQPDILTILAEWGGEAFWVHPSCPEQTTGE